MVTGLASSVSYLDNGIARGDRRSHFSMRLNIFRGQRWLLVQFISTPAEERYEGEAQTNCMHAQAHTRERVPLDRVLDEYCASRLLRQGF